MTFHWCIALKNHLTSGVLCLKQGSILSLIWKEAVSTQGGHFLTWQSEEEPGCPKMNLATLCGTRLLDDELDYPMRNQATRRWTWLCDAEPGWAKINLAIRCGNKACPKMNLSTLCGTRLPEDELGYPMRNQAARRWTWLPYTVEIMNTNDNFNKSK